jgi:ubiquinone/menaquinone biosynthesis C-methylase UbiE
MRQIEMGNRPIGGNLSEREDWDRSAEEYAIFASRTGFYRYTAETMLQLAEIEPGMIVVDLACGTGSVTESILRQSYGEAVKIIAIDFSSRMLACAQRRITSGNVEFFCEKAENLSKVARTKVDRILCNAAFWMFDKAQVLSKIHRVLKPAGKCLMGLHPQFRLSEIRAPHERNTVFWMILKEKAIRGYPSTNSYGRSGSQSDLAAKENCVLASLDDYNLKITRRERIAVHCTPKEQIDFLRIPVMAKGSSLFAGVPDREVTEILDVVQNQVESMEVFAPPIPWQISVLEVIE